MKKIALSVAHSRLKQSIISGYSEYFLSLSICNYMFDVLQKEYQVAIFDKSIFEKSRTYNHALMKNIDNINKFSPDICVEPHFNAAKLSGDYSLVLHSSSKMSIELAEKVSAEFSIVIPVDRNLLADAADPRYSGDAFIYKTLSPAIITEPIFLDNKKHALWLDTQGNLNKISMCIIRGINNFFEKWKGH